MRAILYSKWIFKQFITFLLRFTKEERKPWKSSLASGVYFKEWHLKTSVVGYIRKYQNCADIYDNSAFGTEAGKRSYFWDGMWTIGGNQKAIADMKLPSK